MLELQTILLSNLYILYKIFSSFLLIRGRSPATGENLRDVENFHLKKFVSSEFHFIYLDWQAIYSETLRILLKLRNTFFVRLTAFSSSNIVI